MERVEAELRGWPSAPFSSKEEVDANCKRLLDLALAPDLSGALQVGVASHNRFDVAWALVRDAEAGGGRVDLFRLRPLHPAVLRLAMAPDTDALEGSLGVAAMLGVTVELSCATPSCAPNDARFPGSLVEATMP